MAACGSTLRGMDMERYRSQYRGNQAHDGGGLDRNARCSRQQGARATWLFAAAVCMPEGKNRARAGLRDRQAFTSRGAWIQLGSSQAPTNAVEKTIWPVSRPFDAAAPSSRSRGFIKPEGGGSSGTSHGPGRNPVGASARPQQLLAQGSEGLLLGSLHRHRADLELRRDGPQGEPFEDGEPQGRGLGCRQLLHQLLQRRPG